MKPKTPIEEKAAARQIEYLTEALETAKSSEGYWMNMAGRYYPRFYPKGPEVSPFNALTMALFADRNGYNTSLFTTFTDAKARGESVREKERGVPFNWYNWKTYVNRHNPDEYITRGQYLSLEPEMKEQYKGIHDREIRVLFNIDQTLTPYADEAKYRTLLDRYGSMRERGNEKAVSRQLHITTNYFIKAIKENLVPIRKDGTSVAHYDRVKDVIYMPEPKSYEHFVDYVQDLMREIARATGHQQRCAREGMVMKGGQPPTEEALKHEELVVEIIAGIKMMELGMPARLSPTALGLVDGWNRELREDHQLIDTVEADINNAMDVIRKAEKGEKVTYYSEMNRLATEEMKQKSGPSVSSEESAILADIIRNSGLLIADANFKDEGEKKVFLEKFDLTYYYNRLTALSEMTKSSDPEIADMAYTEILGVAAGIDQLARGYKPNEWYNKGTYLIYDMIREYPSSEKRDFVVITDAERKRADVLLQEGAFSRGEVVFPDGRTRPFHLSPDEALSAQERSESGAKVQYKEVAGLSKQRIAHALEKQGMEYVRFFNTEGIASFRPNDSYFAGKKVELAHLRQWELTDVQEIDISQPLEKSRSVTFDKVEMTRDDENRWVILLYPTGEETVCIHPDKSDVNQFFSTSKQKNKEDTERIRAELAQKYYAMSKVNPELKVDLFGPKADETILARVQRANIFKGKDGNYLCVPVIEGAEKVQPRVVSETQWKRLWLAPDTDAYKRNLVATLFADILCPEQEQHVNADPDRKQNEETATVQEEKHGGMRR